MAQFVILESTTPEGKPAQLSINVEQVCRVFALGPADAPETLEVYMSDGQRFILQAEAAFALLRAITHPRNAIDPRPLSPS